MDLRRFLWGIVTDFQRERARNLEYQIALMQEVFSPERETTSEGKRARSFLHALPIALLLLRLSKER